MRTKTSEEGERSREQPERRGEQRRAAQSAVQDMTRNIQRKHEKELKDLQFAGANGRRERRKTVQRRPEDRPQRSLPLRQRQEIQEVPRRVIGNPPNLV